LNRELYAAEENRIESVIKTDSITYERSANGFYYAFTLKDSLDGLQPRFGDRVTFEYDVVSLSGDTIYRKQDLSPITKSLEQEYGIFKGMREALKLMQDGEEMIVYFPSYSAYGYYGDNNRIGTNVPFKSRVKLLQTQRQIEE
jgi:gliding motility-associated peptidyl-prolyl isomerase